MLSALTTNVTNFFRERHHFEHLRQQVLPPLIASARAGGKLRIWSAGCSTGQEPYSIALSLLSLEPQAHRLDAKILATDIDPRVVEVGRGAFIPKPRSPRFPPICANVTSRAAPARNASPGASPTK